MAGGVAAPRAVARQLRPAAGVAQPAGPDAPTQQVGDGHRQVNRLHKVLEDANIKLTRVATDVMGVSGRAMLAELIKGQTDAATLAELAKGRLRRASPAAGSVKWTGAGPSPFSVGAASEPYRLSAMRRSHNWTSEIEETMRPFAAVLATWDSLLGINRRLARDHRGREIGPRPGELCRCRAPRPRGLVCVGQQPKCRHCLVAQPSFSLLRSFQHDISAIYKSLSLKRG